MIQKRYIPAILLFAVGFVCVLSVAFLKLQGLGSLSFLMCLGMLVELVGIVLFIYQVAKK